MSDGVGCMPQLQPSWIALIPPNQLPNPNSLRRLLRPKPGKRAGHRHIGMVAGTARIQDLIAGGSELDLEGFKLTDELSLPSQKSPDLPARTRFKQGHGDHDLGLI